MRKGSVVSVKWAERTKPTSSVVEQGAGALWWQQSPAAKKDWRLWVPTPATHSWLSLAQVPFWNGCSEDEHCVPDLLLDAHSDLPTAM